MRELFDGKGHLSVECIEVFKEGKLKNDELIIAAEHIGTCEKCAKVLAESFKQEELVEAPEGFEEEVINKIKKKGENNMHLVYYAIKVTLAACIALAIVFSNQFNEIANKRQINCISFPKYKVVDSINRELNSFSQKLINMEVFSHAKEKK